MEKSRYSEKIYELQDNIGVKYPTQIQMLETNTEKSRKDFELSNQCQQVKHRHIFTMHFCGICGILFFLVPYFLKNFASV